MVWSIFLCVAGLGLSSMSMQIARAEIITAPTIEPLTLSQAKRQVFVAESDTTHDENLIDAIQAAREQWEHDTDSAVMTQTIRVRLAGFSDDDIDLRRRPIQSITSITYYDSGNALQTLSTSVYSLDQQSQEVRLAYLQQWPLTAERWDAVAINYVAGYTARNLVPAIAKQAMLLLVGYYFDANRGDNDRQYDQRAYERLVMRYMRSSYP